MKQGSKVKFISASDEQVKWGGNTDPRGLLNTTDVYEVEKVEVHSWHTKLYLKGVKGKFNNVHFKEVEPDSLQGENNRLREALEDILNPIGRIRRNLKEGEQINGGYAVMLSKDPSHLQEIAREALSTSNPTGEPVK